MTPDWFWAPWEMLKMSPNIRVACTSKKGVEVSAIEDLGKNFSFKSAQKRPPQAWFFLKHCAVYWDS